MFDFLHLPSFLPSSALILYQCSTVQPSFRTPCLEFYRDIPKCCDSLLHSFLTPAMVASSTQLPFELVEIITSEFWYSEHDSDTPIAFMAGFPLVCSLLRVVYASITSRDVSVLTARYLYYLSSIILFQKVFHLQSFSPRIYPHHHLLCQCHRLK
ncbi:hypothetical protein F5146DRAFT_138815 [Armillaria mellea]|nr:hypothetical protein F5146DRAFT_138815 [Armillaria mellea]